MRSFKKKLKEKSQHPGVWSFVTYFAEGFPFSIVHYLASLFFTYSNVRLEFLGLTSLYHLPWNIKFLWSTLVDQFATKRKWIQALEFLLLLATIGLAVATQMSGGLKIIAIIFLIISFLSATHDIAIDGYYLEKLNTDDQAKYVGLRVTAYRVSMLVISSGIVYVSHISWQLAFWLCAVIIFLFFLYNYYILPPAEKQKRKASEMLSLLIHKRTIMLYSFAFIFCLINMFFSEIPFLVELKDFFALFSVSKIIAYSMLFALIVTIAILPIFKKKIYKSDSFFAKSFISLLDQPKIQFIIIFILLFRLGESLLLSMKSPFLKGIGITLVQLSLLTGVFGIIATIVGSIFGGWLISRFSLKKMIWPSIIAQNIFNLLYMLLAWYYQDIYFSGAIENRPVGMPSANLFLVGGVISIEAFGAGIGTSAFMIYIMRCIKSSYRASHTAFWTAIMSIGVLVTGPISGVLAKNFGFTTFFGLSFLITVPSMLLIFFVPYLNNKTAQDYE